MQIKLYNTLTNLKEIFTPLDPDKIKIYVCGPTVYDIPHIGNARSIIVYDILFRLFIKIYGPEKVIYVRNITDVDDKINQAALEKKISIDVLTKEITQEFHKDIDLIDCLRPNYEPRATEHINEMIEIIYKLIENNNAYISKSNHVYFRVKSSKDYGKLAGRKIDELMSGARIEINEEKENPEDFVLWKPAGKNDDKSSIFESPWGKGRPGWHIECSAMSNKYLGQDFDIHGGGADLMFPHHTNEIAQSCAAFPSSKFAKFWVHNGFVTVRGEKMSKSLGNFITIRSLIEKEEDPVAIRYALLSTHYRKPLDWNDKLLQDSYQILNNWKKIIPKNLQIGEPTKGFLELLANDLNISECFSYLHTQAKNLNNNEIGEKFLGNLALIGINLKKFIGKGHFKVDTNLVEKLIQERKEAKITQNFVQADQIREKLLKMGIKLKDNHDGTTEWEI